MGMTTGGIIFMATAWSIIIILTAYCFIKVIKSERKNRK
jgi:hypothetical protein